MPFFCAIAALLIGNAIAFGPLAFTRGDQSPNEIVCDYEPLSVSS